MQLPRNENEKLGCDTVAIDAVFEEISKNESDMTPYGKYLLSQPRGYTVGFWSEEGQKLFMEMTNNERLPPVGIKNFLDDWIEECNGDTTNTDHVFAAMLVDARSDYQWLVPFYGEYTSYILIVVMRNLECNTFLIPLLFSHKT